MKKRATLVRGVAVLALIGLLAGALATSSGAAAPVSKKKVKKIAKRISNKVSNNVFNQNIGDYASRVASGYNASPPDTGVMATTSITVPASGYLVLDGIMNVFDGGSAGDTGSCSLRLNGTGINSSEYNFTVDDVESENQECLTHHVASVTPGTYAVDLFSTGLTATGSTSDARVTALYAPLGATGTRP